MESMGPCNVGLMQMFDTRVIPVCGDLGQPNLGLTQDAWDFLATQMDAVFHNGCYRELPVQLRPDARCERAGNE